MCSPRFYKSELIFRKNVLWCFVFLIMLQIESSKRYDNKKFVIRWHYNPLNIGFKFTCTWYNDKEFCKCSLKSYFCGMYLSRPNGIRMQSCFFTIEAIVLISKMKPSWMSILFILRRYLIGHVNVCLLCNANKMLHTKLNAPMLLKLK